MKTNRISALLFVAGLFLFGCPQNPHPPTEQSCFDDSDIAENCYTCASAPVCAWCPSSNAVQRGCRPRTQPFDCEGAEPVRISDLCNDLDEGLDRP